MTSNTNFVSIDIALTNEELELEKLLDKKSKIQLSVPPDFENEIAWELANLTRIAYKDYELFNKDYELFFNSQKSQKEQLKDSLFKDTLHEGFALYTSSTISSATIKKYLIERNPPIKQDADSSGSQDKIAANFNEGFYKYSILGTYNYLAYSVGTPFKPDVDNFGFIAERKKGDGSKLVFVVFRGTLEPEEWFNDFQFKQIAFLMQSEDDTDPSSVEVSLGFNKIYTDFRPGIFMDHDIANWFSRSLDKKSRDASKNKYPSEHNLHSGSIMSIIQNTLKEYASQDVPIYFTGHSLGAALATISALHISRILNLDLSQQGVKPRVFLYTFASPRVGNQKFANECNERFTTYRIANSEDLVPGIPPATLKFIGNEMKPSQNINKLIKALSWITGGVTEDVFEHVGNSICFTSQIGAISSNHNMSVTYCNALRNIQHC